MKHRYILTLLSLPRVGSVTVRRLQSLYPDPTSDANEILKRFVSAREKNKRIALPSLADVESALSKVDGIISSSKFYDSERESPRGALRPVL